MNLKQTKSVKCVKELRTMTKFEFFEIVLHFLIWIAAIARSLYNFYLSCRIFDAEEDRYGDLQSGWRILSKRKQDVSDEEWSVILYYMRLLAPWCIAHMAIMEVLRSCKLNITSNKSHLILWYHISISLIFMVSSMHPITVIVLLSQPCAFSIIHYLFRSNIAIWVGGLIILTFLTGYKSVDLSSQFPDVEFEQFSITIIAAFWIFLRCLSFYLDKLNDKMNASKRGLLHLFAYCFYLPLIFGGPFVTFNDYFNFTVECSLKTRLDQFLRRISKVILWTFVAEFLLHFFYVNIMRFYVDYVKTFDAWTIYGYGYAMGQFFHIKYVVLFGFGSAFATFDGVAVPNLPKCIGRIHIYSDMWKYFDEGFYKFIFNYIYIPIMENRKPNFFKKIVSSFACFSFVYLWHGVEKPIFIWTLINFLGVVLENTFKCANQIYFRHLALSTAWRRRIEGLVATPLLAVTAIGNSYFFAGYDIGNAFYAFLFNSFPYTNAILFFIFYSCCHVSIQVKSWENKRN